MGLMDVMMERMIKSMSPEERENMLLEMMPEMMKRLDVSKALPPTAGAMGELVNITGLATFVSRAANDREIGEQLGELHKSMPELSGKMAAMMSEMKDVMPVIMGPMMEFKMRRIMPVMMPMMMQMMPIMMRDQMPKMLESNPEMCEMMPQMMHEVMPHCVATFLPVMAPEKRTAFMERLTGAIESGEAASKVINLDEAEI